MLDGFDRTLLRLLMHDGRATWADLAVELGLTAPAVAQRVRRLQDRGVIRHFAAWVAPGTVAPLTAFVEVSIGAGDDGAALQQGLERLDSVQECYRLSGEYQYLLKLRCASLDELARLLDGDLPRAWPGVIGPLRSRVVLATLEESTVLPVPEPLSQLDTEESDDAHAATGG